jgi:hypothetical protein
MSRRFLCWTFIAWATLIGSGCKGDEKGVNRNKEKPEPARTEKMNPAK